MITLDNYSTNDNAMKEIQDKMSLPSLILRGRLMHMCCAAHIIHLIVKDGIGAKDALGLKVVEEGIGRIRETDAFWSATPKRHEQFERVVLQEGIKYDNKIALDVKTRWNSTYLMLSVALNYRLVFDRLAKKEKLCFPFRPTEEDWEFARYLCDRLKLFYDTTKLLSGTSYVTSSLFFPKICGIYLAIQKWQASDNPTIKSMSATMKDKFMKYWTDIHGPMAVATVLDPRCKMKFLYAMYTQIYGPDGMVREVQKVKDLLIDLVKEYESSFVEGFGATDGGSSSSKAQNEGDAEVDEIFDKYMAAEPAVLTTKVCTELDMYLEEDMLPRTLELDVIEWWKVGGFKYTALRKVARDILAISVTTVASESVFSTSGTIISPNYSRLAPNMVEALMCMQAWARADMLGITCSFQFLFPFFHL
jgi:acyl-CoA synthetase (AMP-forming)/AMP-acid ligase II